MTSGGSEHPQQPYTPPPPQPQYTPPAPQVPPPAHRVPQPAPPQPLYAPPPMLSRMVEAGLLGRKVGRGFYDYSKR